MIFELPFSCRQNGLKKLTKYVISISFNTNQTIASVQDGAERYAYFHYNGASATASDPLLSSISYAESQRSVEFEYTNKRLTKIKYKDGTFSTYTYSWSITKRSSTRK